MAAAKTAELHDEDATMLAATMALPVSGFVGCSLAAALNDARTLRIPNKLSVAILALFGVHAAITLTLAATAIALALAGATLIVAFIGYSRGWMGGGDAKLLAVCMAWAGPRYAAEFLIVTALAGGVIALALQSPFTVVASTRLRQNWPIMAASEHAMPYGVAIAAGALAVAIEIFSA